MAEPSVSENGFGMNDANMSFAKASCLITRRAVMMLSAQLLASDQRSSMPFWDGAWAWKEYSTGMDMRSSMSVVSRRRSRAESHGVRSKYPALSCGIGFTESPK